MKIEKNFVVLVMILGFVSLGYSRGLASQAVVAVNKVRKSGAPCSHALSQKVRWSPSLSAEARKHSLDMAREGKIGHRNFRQRLRRAGYKAYGAENVAMGSRLKTPREVVALWAKSPAHCRNLMNGRFNVIGMGEAVRNHNRYWTLILAEE